MLPPDLISLLVAPLNRLGVAYMVTGSVAHGHFNLIHINTGLKTGFFFVGGDRVSQRALALRQRVVDQHGEPVWFAPPEYVILSKLQYLRDSGSPKHISDIQAILQVRGDSLDQQFLLGEIDALGLQAVWDKIHG